MKIEIISTGAAISFPFELKDTFRNAFPSAKWNPAAKRWEVGTRSVRRLEQWSAEIEASGIVAELADRDARELGENELADLRRSIENVRALIVAETRKLRDLERLTADREAAIAELSGLEAELAVARAATSAAEISAKASAGSMQEVAAQAIDIEAFKAARNEMHKLARRGRAADRVKYNELKDSTVVPMREALIAAGFVCSALTRAATEGWNKVSRDPGAIMIEIKIKKAD